MSGNALAVQGLTKRYKDFVLDNVSFVVPRGAIVGLVGENGAGKSTTLHAILGLIHRDGGSVELLGREDTAVDESYARDVLTDVTSRFDYSRLILETDYYRVVFGDKTPWDLAETPPDAGGQP